VGDEELESEIVELSVTEADGVGVAKGERVGVLRGDSEGV